jgi:hypothetical protein
LTGAYPTGPNVSIDNPRLGFCGPAKPDSFYIDEFFARSAAGPIPAADFMGEQVKREPAMGAMREGQIVLVDDGSCPNGQIKQVAGGNHIKFGGTKQIVRARSCVPR